MYFYVRRGGEIFSRRRHPSYFVNTVEESRGNPLYLTLFTGLRPAEQVGVYTFKQGRVERI